MKLDLILLRGNLYSKAKFNFIITSSVIGKTKQNIITFLVAVLSNNH